MLVQSHNKNITNDILIDLGTHPTLSHLDLQKTGIEDVVIEEQQVVTPGLTILGPKIDQTLLGAFSRPQKRFVDE